MVITVQHTNLLAVSYGTFGPIRSYIKVRIPINSVSVTVKPQQGMTCRS